MRLVGAIETLSTTGCLSFLGQDKDCHLFRYDDLTVSELYSPLTGLAVKIQSEFVALYHT